MYLFNFSFRKVFCTVLFLSTYYICRAQTPIAPNKDFIDPKVFTPQTPDAAGLFKVNESSVDFASGAVNTSIPLFTAVSGRISVPVSINYNSSGIKVQEVASSLGLGWNLNFGYSISVTEEEPKQFAYSTKIYKGEFEALAATNLNELWMQEMKRSTDGYYPTMFPVYRFSCGSYSGIFYFDEHNNNNLVKLGSREAADIRIDRQLQGSLITSFTVTTPDGLQYIFDKKETSLRVAQQNALGPTTTSFLCSKVLDVLTGDAVSFEYTAVPTYTTYSETSRMHYTDTHVVPPADWQPDDNINFTTRMDVSSWVVSRIIFKDGYATFDVANDRLDICPTRIKGVTLRSTASPGVVYRKIDFQQGYFLSSGGSADQYNHRLRLEGITFNAIEMQTAVPVENYSFNYNSIVLPPYRLTANFREQNANSIDYWGYYKGGLDYGNSFLPQDICNQFAIPSPYTNYGVDRKANPAYTQAGVLTSIQYPSGGVAAFEYENHQYAGYYLGDNLGGLRIKNIKYFTQNGQTIPAFQKAYKYIETIPLTSVAKSTFSYLEAKGYVYNPNDPYYNSRLVQPYGVQTITSDPLYDFAYHNGSPLFYKQVEEYNGTPESNKGKTIYSSYYTPPYYAPTDCVDMGKLKLFAESFGRGQLARKEVYKATGVPANPYEKVAQEINTYTGGGAHTSTLPNNGMVGFAVRKNTLQVSINRYWDLVGSLADSYYSQKANANEMPVDAFIYNNFYLLGEEPKFVKREESKFFNGQEVKTTTEVFYESAFHSRMTSVIVEDSKEKPHKREFKYVQDRNNIIDQSIIESNAAFNALITVNKLDDIIEEKESVNNVVTRKMRDRYITRWNQALELDIPVIGSQERTSYVNSSSDISKIFVDGYNDALKMLGIYNEGGPVKAFLYDDNNSHLVAEVANASKGEVRYTSFEAGAMGGWSYTNARTYDPVALSGGYVYNLNSTNTLSASDLNATKTYVVSYWSRNGAYSVNSTSPIQSVVTNTGWTYYQHKVPGAASIAIVGTGVIDEVRLYPINSKMTSYTYDPLKGLTSKTDSKDQVTHFEYDGLQRLINIKDQKGNIVKHIDYHYQGQ